MLCIVVMNFTICIYLGVKMEPQSPNNLLGHHPAVHHHQNPDAFGLLEQHQGYYHSHHHHHQIHQRAEWNEPHQLYPPELRYHHPHSMMGQHQQV